MQKGAGEVLRSWCTGLFKPVVLSVQCEPGPEPLVEAHDQQSLNKGLGQERCAGDALWCFAEGAVYMFLHVSACFCMLLHVSSAPAGWHRSLRRLPLPTNRAAEVFAVLFATAINDFKLEGAGQGWSQQDPTQGTSGGKRKKAFFKIQNTNLQGGRKPVE